MDSNLLAFLVTTFGVTIAEMGDKTQLLAMAFAAKYKISKVFLGIGIAIVLLSSSAVAVGNLVARFETLEIWIKAAASISFLVFGLMTLRNEGEECDVSSAKCKPKLGPVVTVAIAFFIAELGDKTQLATMAFAAQFPTAPIGVFFGGTVGLLIANGLGIKLGDFISKRVAPHKIKLVSAAAFILFGFIGAYQVTASMLGLPLHLTAVILLLLAVVVGSIAYFMIRQLRRLQMAD